MKIRTILITTVLVVGAGTATSFIVRRTNDSSAKAVEVVAVPLVNSASYNYGDSGTVSGTIISKDTQVVTLDTSHDLVGVYVVPGDRVKKGDKLLEYDMLADELHAEMEELTKLGLELRLRSQKKDLETLRSGRMPDGEESDDYSDFSLNYGDDDDDAGSVYGEDGDKSGSADTLAGLGAAGDSSSDTSKEDLPKAESSSAGTLQTVPARTGLLAENLVLAGPFKTMSAILPKEDVSAGNPYTGPIVQVSADQDNSGGLFGEDSDLTGGLSGEESSLPGSLENQSGSQGGEESQGNGSNDDDGDIVPDDSDSQGNDGFFLGDTDQTVSGNPDSNPSEEKTANDLVTVPQEIFNELFKENLIDAASGRAVGGLFLENGELDLESPVLTEEQKESLKGIMNSMYMSAFDDDSDGIGSENRPGDAIPVEGENSSEKKGNEEASIPLIVGDIENKEETDRRGEARTADSNTGEGGAGSTNNDTNENTNDNTDNHSDNNVAEESDVVVADTSDSSKEAEKTELDNSSQNHQSNEESTDGKKGNNEKGGGEVSAVINNIVEEAGQNKEEIIPDNTDKNKSEINDNKSGSVEVSNLIEEASQEEPDEGEGGNNEIVQDSLKEKDKIIGGENEIENLSPIVEDPVDSESDSKKHINRIPKLFSPFSSGLNQLNSFTHNVIEEAENPERGEDESNTQENKINSAGNSNENDLSVTFNAAADEGEIISDEGQATQDPSAGGQPVQNPPVIEEPQDPSAAVEPTPAPSPTVEPTPDPPAAEPSAENPPVVEEPIVEDPEGQNPAVEQDSVPSDGNSSGENPDVVSPDAILSEKERAERERAERERTDRLNRLNESNRFNIPEYTSTNEEQAGTVNVEEPPVYAPETNFTGDTYVDEDAEDVSVGELVGNINQFLNDVNNISAAADTGWDAIAPQIGAIDTAIQQFRNSFAETDEHQAMDLFGNTVNVTDVHVSTEVRGQVGEATASVMKEAYDRLCAYHFIHTMLTLNPARTSSSALQDDWFRNNEQAIRDAVSEFTNLPDSLFIYNPATQSVEFSAQYASMNDTVFGGESILTFLRNAVHRLNYYYAVEESVDEPDTYSTEGEMMDDGGYDDEGGDDGPLYTAEEIQEAIKEQEKLIKETELQIREAELGIREYKKILDGRIVYATMDGIVKDAGSMDSSSSSNAFITITGREGLYVRGTVNELSLDTVKVGDVITGTSYETGSNFAAEIVEISPYPDTGNNLNYYGYGDENANSSYYPFLAYIENAEGLSVDSYVDLSLTGNASSMGADPFSGGLTLDEYFIRTDSSGRSYCYVRGEDGLLEKRYLEIGANNWGSVTIKSGLRQTDYIAFPYGKGVEEGAPTVEVNYLSAVEGDSY